LDVCESNNPGGIFIAGGVISSNSSVGDGGSGGLC
jgi:hypothetical protein